MSDIPDPEQLLRICLLVFRDVFITALSVRILRIIRG